jgi:hypothetical protein
LARQYFLAQLRESTTGYTSNAVSTALVFLTFISWEEAVTLLKQRHQRILDRLDALYKEIGDITKHSRLSQMTTIRLLEHLRLEARWTENALNEITEVQW